MQSFAILIGQCFINSRAQKTWHFNKCWKRDIWHFHERYELILNLRAATCPKKLGHLGTEETSCWDSNVVPFLYEIEFELLKSPGFSLSCFAFHYEPNDVIWWKVWSSATELFYYDTISVHVVRACDQAPMGKHTERLSECVFMCSMWEVIGDCSEV